MIGTPYDTDVPVANISLTDGTSVKTWTAAVSAGWCDPTMLAYTAAGYTPITAGTATSMKAAAVVTGLSLTRTTWALIIRLPSRESDGQRGKAPRITFEYYPATTILGENSPCRVAVEPNPAATLVSLPPDSPHCRGSFDASLLPLTAP